MSKSSGEAIQVSYTVATLDARSKMSRMRMLLSRPGYQDGDALREAIAAELDNLTDVLTDAYQRVDGMVDDESYMTAREGFRDEIEKLEDEVTEKEKEIDVLNERVEEYQQILKGSEDATQMKLAELLQKQETHERDLQRMHDKARQADERARTATAQLAANQIRMAAWSSDKTAVETADHYRIKYEEAIKGWDALKTQVNAALKAAHLDAGRSKVKAETIRYISNLIRF